MTILDLLGLIGVAAIVSSYFLLQAERMRFDDWSYLLMNAGGAIAIILSLMVDFNLSALAMEGFWLLISGFGIAKRLMRAS
jgi:hypothetical protein